MIITLMHWPPRRRSNRAGSRSRPPASAPNTASQPFLSDSHWLLIADVLADPPPSAKGGRPRVPLRACLEGVLWMLGNGARWQDLPERYPSFSTCWRRLRDWTHEGRFVQAWRLLLEKIDRLRGINWEEAMADGSFSRAKKGGAEVGYGRKGNGTTIMLMVDGEGTPLSAFITAANISEVHAIETLVDERVTSKTPKRLMYDKAADADWLRETLGVRGIALICPHRANRQKPSVQDGRAMRRYKHRFKVERSISWLHNCRRLITRWEYDPDLFEGFVHLACLFTTLKGF